MELSYWEMGCRVEASSQRQKKYWRERAVVSPREVLEKSLTWHAAQRQLDKVGSMLQGKNSLGNCLCFVSGDAKTYPWDDYDHDSVMLMAVTISHLGSNAAWGQSGTKQGSNSLSPHCSAQGWAPTSPMKSEEAERRGCDRLQNRMEALFEHF